MDGTVRVTQSGTPSDVLRLPWHVAPLATSDNGLSRPTPLDSHGRPGHDRADRGRGGGRLVRRPLPARSDRCGREPRRGRHRRGRRPLLHGRHDRRDRRGAPVGGVDEFARASTWLEFLTDDNEPTEPVEIGVQTWGVHNVTETLEVDVLIDAGADGVFADERAPGRLPGREARRAGRRGLRLRPVLADPVR